MARRLKSDFIVAMLADLVTFICLAYYILLIQRDGPHTPNLATGQTIVFSSSPHMTYVSQTQIYILCGLGLLFFITNFILYVKLANSFPKRDRARRFEPDSIRRR
jgi:hypothetical protein